MRTDAPAFAVGLVRIEEEEIEMKKSKKCKMKITERAEHEVKDKNNAIIDKGAKTYKKK